MTGPSEAPPAPSREAGLVACAAYFGGRRVKNITVDEARAWAGRDGHFVWIGLHEPAPELLERVQAQFELHPLAIEDAANAHQRPKLEQYGAAVFIVR